MQPTTVIFDLFGTLTPPFTRSRHTTAMNKAAVILGVENKQFLALWRETYKDRIGGTFTSIRENFAHICVLMKVTVDESALETAAQRYFEFSCTSIQPKHDALPMLRDLLERSIAIGLISNCAPDIPHAWRQNSMNSYFDFAAFSCRVGLIKPDERIYRYTLDQLGAQPSETAYIGDGSDNELSAALNVGMRAVLVQNDLSNVYDSRRDDVDKWRGHSVRSLSELPALLFSENF